MKLCISFIVSLCLPALAGGASATKVDAGELYSKITDAYMTGKFDELKTSLAQSIRLMRHFTAQQRVDILYVRKALAECRPKWWDACKAGKKTFIKQPIFGKTAHVAYDPEGKEGLRVKSDMGVLVAEVSWDPKSMDSTEKGMYGFPKGDIVCGGIWSNIATARLWLSMPLKLMQKMDDRDKLQLTRYMSFRTNLAALYYTTPSSRRYFMHIYFAAFYYDNWGKGEVSGARRAVGAMIMSEILKDPSRYPSLKLPKKLDAEKAEEKLGQHYKVVCHRNRPWTIAEDRQMRAAIKSFAAAANQTVFKTEKVILPNKLVFAIDAKVDETIRAKRDAWIKKQFDKANSSSD